MKIHKYFKMLFLLDFMTLTESEIKELRRQLIGQLGHLSPAERKEAEEQINSMSPEALEAMVEQQKGQGQKIFRMIVEGKIPSVKVGENSEAIAVLSVKSISRGHTIIIPKTAVGKKGEFPKEGTKLSEEISKKLIGSLGAKSTEVIAEEGFGEIVLNVIPIYDKPLDLGSKRKDIGVEELEKVKIEINVKKINKEPEKIKIEKKKEEGILKLKRIVP